MPSPSRPPVVLVVAGVLALAVAAGALSWFYLGGGTPAPPPPAPVKAALRPMKQTLKPALEAPHPAEEPPPTSRGNESLLAKLSKNGGSAKLTPDQLQTYLLENRRNAESLLIASRLSGDLNLLREAAKQNPGDPRVQFDLATRGETDAERRAAIQALRQAAPDNAMGDYLSAMDHFKNKDPLGAMEDIKAAIGKGRMDDYTTENIQGAEEAYLAAGYSAADAKTAAMIGMPLPQIQQLSSLAKQIGTLQQDYLKANDVASAEAVSRSGLAMAQQMQTQLGSRFLINDMVGMAMESRVLAGIDPTSVLDSGITAQQRMDQIKQHNAEIKDLSTIDLSVLQNLPARDVTAFFDRSKIYGEASALQWLRARYPH